MQMHFDLTKILRPNKLTAATPAPVAAACLNKLGP